MIIIGSSAMHFHDPEWITNDLDIIGTDVEFERLRKHLERSHRSPIIIERGTTHKGMIAFNPRQVIDWLTPELESSQMILDLDDHHAGKLFDLDVQFASIETLTAIKRGHLGLDNTDKTEEHLEAMQALCGTLSDAHTQIEQTIRAEYLSRSTGY